jgi:hypothetical protein
VQTAQQFRDEWFDAVGCTDETCIACGWAKDVFAYMEKLERQKEEYRTWLIFGLGYKRTKEIIYAVETRV